MSNSLKSYEKLIYLLSCALNECAPEAEYLIDADYAELHRQAKFHSLTAMAFSALKSGGLVSPFDSGVFSEWAREADMVLRKNMLMDAEREEILAEMESAGIWYLPLKGILIQDMYPQYGMRQMSDNDILYDAEKSKELRSVFAARGYSFNLNNPGLHDDFTRQPLYHFEMHRALFTISPEDSVAAKYTDVKSRLLPLDGTQFGRRFTDNDFYVYVILHAFRHFHESGIGLRTLTDILVVNRTLTNSLNNDYIKSELKESGADAFEEQSRALAEKLFGSSEYIPLSSLSADEAELLDYYISSGTHGTVENRVKLQLSGMNSDNRPRLKKLGYILSRVFPGKAWWHEHYPITIKHPLLIPVLCCYRLFRAAAKRQDLIRNEINTVKKL